MRLLQTMAGAEHGGAESFFTRLAIALTKTDLSQQVVIRENPERYSELRAGNVEVLQLPFGGKFDLRTPLVLKREIKKFDPDVVLTWMNRATQKTPAGGSKYVKVARLGGYYDLKYYQDCDHLIGNTQDIVSYLIHEGWPAERAHYVPNFVSEEQMAPLARMEFSTPDGAPLILAMGRLHENKAFDTLLRALAHTPGVYLWLAGDGPLRKDLEKLAEKLGIRPRVRFLGWREDGPALHAASDVFVCPSRHEPLGNVVLEGWAQARPVVAAKSDGPESLITHGENGLLCEIDDPVELAQSIKKVLEDPDLALKLASKGWETFQAHFTEKVVVQKYLDFFQKVCNAKKQD